MSKDKKLALSKAEGLIPELRFPEFVNKGEWTETVLGSVVEIKGRIGYRGYTTADIVEKGQGAITLSPSNFAENGQLNFEKCTYITWEKYEESPEIMLEEGQTVLVKTASVGKTAYVERLPEKATVNPQIVVLKPKSIHNRFLSFTISHPNSQTQIKNNVGAGAIPNISQEIISKIEILLPPDRERKEQQKIASCLSSLDEVITAQSQKLELLKEHKKGLMQNLFPQEGEKVPKYRFPEFKNDGEWSLKQLGVDNLIEIKGRIGYRGYTTEDIVSKGEGAISMSPSNIDENWNLNFDKSTYITWEKYEESPEIMLEDGFTALVKTGSSYGKAAYIKNLVEKTTINPQLVVLKPKQINSYFLYLLVTNTAVQKQIQETVVGGAIPTLSQDSISKFEVLVPKPKEQQKIAECFSALNELIILQTQTIEQLKLHKKGLMQSLFPKIID